ncbi:hypothetical protein [Egicoccus sp. AB-alg6-2]|uniref:hypothetical protein n=1 Tax=Egicoccus sp. AB-alg6-2 TaxID=3242692 RepID=UPI00359D7F28
MSATTRSVTTTNAFRNIPPLAVVDLVLGAALLVVAGLDPLHLPTWARWAVAGVGDLLLVIAAAAFVRAGRGGRVPGRR